MNNQTLFDTLYDLFEVTALESEMDEIKRSIAKDEGSLCEQCQQYDPDIITQCACGRNE